MTDFLDEKRKEIQARLDELKPMVEEYQRLEAAERALAGVREPRPGHVRTSVRAARLRLGRGPRQRAARPAEGLRHPRHPGQELVRARPGITIPELAEAMGIKQNYLYRVMPDLAKAGQVTKSGRGWHVARSQFSTNPTPAPR